jgi:carbohydrate-selective porin OprB
MGKDMKRWISLVILFCFVLMAGTVRAAEIDKAQLQQLIQTIQQMKQKVDVLEQKVKQYEEKQEELTQETRELKEAKSKLESLQEALGGISIKADATFVGQGTINNDDNNNTEHDEGDVQDATFSYDLEIESQLWEHGTAYFLIEGGNGEGVDEEVPTLSGFNDDAPGNTSAEVTEAWYEQEVPLGGAGSLTFTLGKVDLTNYFDASEVANDETAQFLSSGFVNNLAVEWPDDNGLGTRVTWSPVEWLDVSLGAAESDSDWENIFDDGFAIFEVGFKPTLMGLEGNYRFYAWANAKDHLDVDDLRKVGKGKKNWSQVDDDNTNWGVGFSFDQKIHKGITLFARGGIMDDDVVAGSISEEEMDTVPIKGAYSLGFQVEGSYWGRDNDVFAVAFGGVVVEDDAEELYRTDAFYGDYYDDPEDVDMENEYHLEVYYKLSFFDGKLEFSPDLQVVWNPNGNGDADTVWVVGTRMQVNFTEHSPYHPK